MVAALAKKHNLILNVDNCFATPIGQRPIDLGADLVVHSATKWIDGQGRVLGGVIAGRADLIKDIYLFCRSTGPSLSAFNAWLLSKSLETLDVRMERHAANALRLANALEGHAKISWLKYPFLPSHPQHGIAIKQMKNGGGVVCFELKGAWRVAVVSWTACKCFPALPTWAIRAALLPIRPALPMPSSRRKNAWLSTSHRDS